MTDELHAYLQDFASKPFVRGVSDCCALAAGWVSLCSGKLIDHPGLGRPLSDAEAAALVRDHGGSVASIARKTLNEAGWQMRDGDPQDGDVIIAERAQTVSTSYLGIWSNGHLVTTSRSGMRMVSRQELKEFESWYHGD